MKKSNNIKFKSLVIKRLSIFVVLVAGLILSGSQELKAVVGAGQQTYYVALDENNVFGTYSNIYNSIDTQLVGQVTIVPSLANTVIIYDHAEDEYEDNLLSPTQATTMIWGDGNLANGILPGYPADVSPVGGVIVLSNECAIPYGQAAAAFDAGDKFLAYEPVSVSRSLREEQVGDKLTGVISLYPQGRFGQVFVAPVGTNTDTAGRSFEIVEMHVMSASDNNYVEIDANADGIYETQVTLEEGQSLRLEGCLEGARVSGSSPLQTQLITGAPGGVKEMRVLNLLPELLWGDEYLSAITEVKNRELRWFIFNSHPNALTVEIQSLYATGQTVIAAGSTEWLDLPDDTAARFTSLGGEAFQVVGVADYDSGAYDWGINLFPLHLQLDTALVGYGNGSDNGTANGSPVWVTPAAPTYVYVDYDANPETGAQTDPLGGRYDYGFPASVLNTYRIYDSSDNDQSGLKMYTLDDTALCLAWGQDDDIAASGSPYVDAGASIFPVAISMQETVFCGVEVCDSFNVAAYTNSSCEHPWAAGWFESGDDGSPLSGDILIAMDAGNNRLWIQDDNNAVARAADLSGYEFAYLDYDYRRSSLDSPQEYVLTEVSIVPGGGYTVIASNGWGTDAQYFSTSIDISAYISTQTMIRFSTPVGAMGNSDGMYIDNVRLRLERALPAELNLNETFSNLAYTNFSHTGGWLSDWTETGDDGSPLSGDIQILQESGDDRLEIRDNGNAIYRSANLTCHETATLVYEVKRVSLEEGEYLITEVADNPAGPFTVLDASTCPGGCTDGAYMTVVKDITSYIGPATTIRFRTPSGEDAIKDSFNSVSYAENDGTFDWVGSWTEVNDDGDPDLVASGSGSIGIMSNRMYFWGSLDGSGAYVYRKLDLSQAPYAQLSFSYGSSIANDGSDTVTVDVSTNLSMGWSNLGTLQGNTQGQMQYSLSAYTGKSNVYIRLAWNNKLDQSDEQFWFDDVTVSLASGMNNSDMIYIDNVSIVSGAGNYPDSDGDDIPDWWMNQQFGHPQGSTEDGSEPDDDPDGDGVDNLGEWLADTLPGSAGSVFEAEVLFSNAAPCIVFDSSSSRKYQVEGLSSLESGEWEPVAPRIFGSGGSITVADPVVADWLFYRVQVGL